MKNNTLIHYTVFIAVSLTGFNGLSLSIQDIKQRLTSANNAAFGKDNFMVARISFDEENNWKNALNETKTFVEENQTSIKLTTPMVEYLNPVFKSSNDLFLALNNAYYNCIKDAIKDPNKRSSGLSVLVDADGLGEVSQKIDASKVSKTCIESKLNPLKASRAELLDSFENLKKKIVLLSSENAREAIYFANFTLRQAFDKAWRDFEKLKTVLGL